MSTPAPSTTAPSAPKTKKAISLKTLVLSFTLASAVIPLSIYGYMSFSEISKTTRDNANGTLLSSNKNNALVVKTWVQSKEQTVKALAENSALKTMELVEAKEYLIRTNVKIPDFQTINLHDTIGMQVARSTNDKLINVADRGYFKQVATGKSTAIESGISRANNKAFIAFSVEVRSATNFLVGVLAGLAPIDGVTSSVTGARIGKTGISYLVDSQTKQILAHPVVTLVGKKLEEPDFAKIDKASFDNVKDGVNSAKKEIKFTASPVADNLVLVSEIDADEINAPITAAEFKTIAFVLASVLFAAFLSFTLAKNITEKINRLSDLATQVSRAKSVTQISELENDIKSVGGAFEIRTIAQALVRLTSSIKIAMRSM